MTPEEKAKLAEFVSGLTYEERIRLVDILERKDV